MYIGMRKYGVAATFDFPVYNPDGVDLDINWVPVAADCELIKDGGASTAITATAVDEGVTYSIALSTTEMQCARGVIKIQDAATKVILDVVMTFDTYGNAAAQHAFDLDTANVVVGSLVAGSITSSVLANNSITNTQLANNAITNGTLATDAITANQIGPGAIGASEIAANAIGASQIATDAFTAAKFAASSLNGKGDWNIGKSGYALTVANWNVGKSGYSLTVAPLTAAQVNTEVDTALADINLDHFVGTATGIPALPAGTYLDLLQDDGTATYDRTTDSVQAIRDRGDAAWITGGGGSADKLVLQDTTILAITSQTVFTLTAGSADNNAYLNCTIVIEDAATAVQKFSTIITAYVGSSRTVTLREAPVFTIIATDKIYILAEQSLKTSIVNRRLDVTSTGEAGLDLNNTIGSYIAGDFGAGSLDGKGDWNINKTGYALTVAPPTATQVVDEWETQSQASPAGFHVNLQEWRGIQPSLLTNGFVDVNVEEWLTSTVTSLISGRVNVSVGANAANVITAASIAANALDGKGDWFAPSVTGTSDSGTSTTMVDAARTESNNHWDGARIVFGSGGSANNIGVERYIDSFVAASDTINFKPAVITAITTETYEIFSASGVNIVDWQGDPPNALISGAVDTDVSAIQANVINAASINAAAMDGKGDWSLKGTTGTSDSGTTTSMIDAARTEIDNHWAGEWIRFGSGGSANNIGVTRLISSFTASTDTILFSPAVATAITTETYEIVPNARVAVAFIDPNVITSTSVAANALNGKGDWRLGTYAGTSDSGGSTTTVVDADRTEADDVHIGSQIQFYTGALQGQTRLITDFDAASDTLTFAPAVTVSVGSGFFYLIWPSSGVDIQSWVGNTTALTTPNALIGGRVDSRNTVTSTEPGQGTPPATASLEDKIDYIYKFLINRKTASNSLISVYNDAATVVDHKSIISDNGTTYDEGEYLTGP